MVEAVVYIFLIAGLSALSSIVDPEDHDDDEE